MWQRPPSARPRNAWSRVDYPKQIEQFLHLVGQGSFERYSRAGSRVVEREVVGVQGLAVERFHGRFNAAAGGGRYPLGRHFTHATVERIANYGVAGICAVDPNLVRTARAEPRFHKGDRPEALPHSYLGNGIARGMARVGNHCHFLAVHRMAADWRFDLGTLESGR